MVGTLGALAAGAGGGAAVNIVINGVDKFSKTFTAAGAATIKLGAAVTAVGVAGAFAMKSMIDEAISFESAFIGVRKTVDLTEEQFEDLEKRFKTLAGEIPFTFQELAKIGEIAGQLGVEGVDNIEIFTKTIADISATTNLTAEEAATNFARFANIMNMPIDQVDRLGSVIVDLGNNLATTEQEILAMGLRIAGAGKALNFTEGEVLAWGAALSSVGIRAELGGTAISKLMINISSMVATGNSDLAGFAKVAGMTSDEFSKAFEEDGSKALDIFFKGLNKVGEEGGNVLQVLEGLDIKEVRLRDAVLRLSSGYGKLDKSLNIQKKAIKENTALTEEAEKRYESMESQLKIVSNKFNILKADLGEELFPILEDIIDIVSSMVGWFSNLSDGTKRLIVWVGAAGTAFALIVGPLLIIVGLIPSIITGFAAIGTAVTVFATIVSPYLIPIAALATVLGVIAVISFAKFNEDSSTAAERIFGIGESAGFTAEELKKFNTQFSLSLDLLERVAKFQEQEQRFGPGLGQGTVMGVDRFISGGIDVQQQIEKEVEKFIPVFMTGVARNNGNTTIIVEGNVIKENDLIDMISEAQNDKLNGMIDT